MKKEKFNLLKKYQLGEKQLVRTTGGHMGLPMLPYYLEIAASKVKEFITDLIKPKK